MIKSGWPRLLKKLFFIAAFLNFTLPRAGFYYHKIPLTGANLLLFALCGFAIVYALGHKRYPWKSRLERLGLFYLGYVIICAIIGFCQGERIKASIGFLVMAGYVLLFFLTVNLLKKERDILLFLRIIIWSLAITISYGALQIVFLKDVSIPGITELYGSAREPIRILKNNWLQVIDGPALSKNIMWWSARGSLNFLFIGHKVFSTFHHGNLFGSYLAMLIPLLCNLSLSRYKRERRGLYLLAVLAMLILIFANSRGAFWGLNMGFLFLVLAGGINRRQLFFRIVTLSLISILLYINIISLAVIRTSQIVGVESSYYLYYNFEHRYLYLGQRAISFGYDFISGRRGGQRDSVKEGLEIDHLASNRFKFLRSAIKNVFGDRPLREILFGNAFRKALDLNLYNFYLWIIFEIGLVGFGLLVLLGGYIIMALKRSLGYAMDEKLKFIVGGCLAGNIAGLVHNLIDSPFYYPPLLANFWIIAGLAMSSIKKPGPF